MEVTINFFPQAPHLALFCAPHMMVSQVCSDLKNCGFAWIWFHIMKICNWPSYDAVGTDGKTTYIRQPIQGAPCYHHTLMPRGLQNFLPENELKHARYGDWLPYTEGLPMLRIPRKSHRHRDAPDHHILYDLVNDPKQNHPIYDAEQQKSWVATLDQALKNVQAPEWQWDRLDMQKA